MADPDTIFLVLKSETRRKILTMLASEPMYLSQLSDMLSLGQQAIFRHLQLLEEAGLLESSFRDAGQGAPRRYYQIARAVRVEVQISPEMFDVGLFDVPRLEVQAPEDYPKMVAMVNRYKELTRKLNSKEKLSAFSELLRELSSELEKINIAKSVAEAAYSNIRRQIRSLSFELLPKRIDQRIIQTLASRGGILELKDLTLILNLSEETVKERLEKLQERGMIRIEQNTSYLI